MTKFIRLAAATLLTVVVAIIMLPESPEMARLNAEKETQRKIEAIKTDVEQRMIQAAVMTVKESLRNPESLKVRQATLVNGSDICLTYSAQNGFGGMNTEQIAFANGKVADYGATCSGKSGKDHTQFASYF